MMKIDRRKVLKCAGAVAGVQILPGMVLGQDPASGSASPQWVVSGDRIHVELRGRRLLSSFLPGYQKNDGWQPGQLLGTASNSQPHSDRCGRGSAVSVRCRLGSLDGGLLLITYDDGRLGYRLSLTNHTGQPVVLESCSPLMSHPSDGTLQLSGHPAEWRVYVDSGACGGDCASHGLMEHNGRNVAGAVSVLWSPTGDESVSIGQVEVERSWTTIVYEYGETGKNNKAYHWAQSRQVHLRLEQDATGYRLDPGETFPLDSCMLVFSRDPFEALVRFRDSMVAFNRVRTFTNNDICVGWMTWYNQEHHLRGAFGATGETSASQAVTLEESNFIQKNGLESYGVKQIAIDDGYQGKLHLGDWLDSTQMFPHGMKGLAVELRKLGMKPGVWLAPFVATEDSAVYREHPEWFVRYSFDWYHADTPVRAYEFDPTSPGALDWLLQVFRTFQQWGYWFYKNDFSGGLISSRGKQYHNARQTGLMRWRWTWRKIKEALGGDGACSIQLCGANNIGAIGIVDTVRTGSDVVPGTTENAWRILREDTATTCINRWWQNKHFFISDPDNLEVAEYRNYRIYTDRLDFESKMALSLDEAKVRTSLVVATGGNIFLGDRLSLLEPERLAILRKALPVFGESAIPLDMFEQTTPSLWWHHVERPWGSWEVISVVNFGETSIVKEIPLERMKLRRGGSVVAWELWSEAEYRGIDNGVLRVAVMPHSVKTLRITPLDKQRTTLVGSSFHYAMGAVEIAEITPTGAVGVTVRVVRPADEQGNLAFWSASRQAVIAIPVMAKPSGAKLTVS